jgi:hypothetical protein
MNDSLGATVRLDEKPVKGVYDEYGFLNRENYRSYMPIFIPFANFSTRKKG